jgi:hypothetical protein
MRFAVRKQLVDNYADDRKDENDKTPEQLVRGRAVREDLNFAAFC